MTNIVKKAIPTSRLSRMGKLGSLATRVASNMLVDGIKQIGRGQSPTLKDLMLQPKNIENLADKLSQLRGAAMKMGQLLSMDAGELLPPELAQLLAKLRSEATPMPHKQLLAVLKQNFGDDWLDKFSHFDLQPFAAASIGQVHIAHAINGDKLAVKVQYPGISKTVESDVDNVATLLKMSKLVPNHIELKPFLDEAKRQLLLEADYQQELTFLQRYRAHLKNDNQYIVPAAFTQLSSQKCLSMSFVEGIEIEQTLELEQSIRNTVIKDLIALFFRELFEFQLIQSDPNFANYQYQTKTQQLILLDFGATRDIPDHISQGYRELLSAAAIKDNQKMHLSAEKIGFFKDNIATEHKQSIIDIFKLATTPLHFEGEFDFGRTNIASQIKDAGLAIQSQHNEWHTPPMDAIYVHRKLAGLYMLASKLQAKVNVRSLFQPYLLMK
ncbi:ABC1 kinase family protein [Thalassotalea aquiviva]|uniref:ABC1 kinase family protein n=1 Tax=Thalassotalea aquiviva TaxID=3242415 RepID=UPI00352A0ACF